MRGRNTQNTKIDSSGHELDGSDVDEPEEFEESDSDWEPHDEEEDEEMDGGRKKRGRQRPLIFSQSVPKKRRMLVTGKSGECSESCKREDHNSSPQSGRLMIRESAKNVPSFPLKAFTNGSFVVVKSDFRSKEKPPLWKIDGKALLQKYIPIESEGQTLYKSTSTYSGWTQNNQEEYASAPVTYVQQGKKEIIIEFNRDQVDL